MLLVAAGYGAFAAILLKSNPAAHTMDAFVQFLSLLLWGALGIAAVMAGPALLEDAQRGALELYLSRSLTRRDWLAGKIAAVLALTFATVFVPALIYILATAILLGDHPANWGWSWAGALGYAAIWSIVVSGLGLGLSCVMRNARAASLVLLGSVAGMVVVLGGLLTQLSQNAHLEWLSPIGALDQQVGWLFPGSKLPYAFPWWYGLAALGVLAAVGWGLVIWRAPRLKGVE